jgi:hypothetical protein
MLRGEAREKARIAHCNRQIDALRKAAREYAADAANPMYPHKARVVLQVKVEKTLKLIRQFEQMRLTHAEKVEKRKK